MTAHQHVGSSHGAKDVVLVRDPSCPFVACSNCRLPGKTLHGKTRNVSWFTVKEVAADRGLLYTINVKRECLSLLLVALAMKVPAAPTNAPSETEKKALDVLRETIYQYERRRGALLPPPTLSTNAAIRRDTNTVVANVPARPIPSTSAPPVVNVQPPVKATPTPAPKPPPSAAALPPTAVPSATPSLAPGASTTVHETSLAELERLYLDGKITAKQFQKYLQQHEQLPATAAAVTTPSPTAAVRTPAPAPVTTANSKPAVAPAKPAVAPAKPPPSVAPASPDQAAISEVEKKMDELIRLKNARDATNVANSATNTLAAGPKTQRQKLDDLLRLYIDGKITDAEYKERREKVIGEPDKK